MAFCLIIILCSFASLKVVTRVYLSISARQERRQGEAGRMVLWKHKMQLYCQLTVVGHLYMQC